MTVVQVDRIHGHAGADAVEIGDGRILGIGRVEALGPVTHERRGCVLVPGLTDSHIHPTGLAANANRVDVSDVRTIDELVERLAQRAASVTGPVVAVGFDDEKVLDAAMPTAAELDRAVPDRPVVVYRHCSHIAAANSAALGAAGIDRDSSDPEGGRIRRFADGRPTGVLEETALTSLSAALASTVDAPDATSVLAVLNELRRRGLVAVDAMVSAGTSMWCAGNDELEVIASLGDDSPVAVSVYVICASPDELRAAAATLGTAGPNVRFAGWKGFADGSLGARTAALRQPYHDDSSTAGMLVGSNLDEMAEAAVELGGRVAIHAIGDRAVERGLEVAAHLGLPGTVRIEHASVIDPDQIRRMAELGVMASVQPSFVRSDAPWLSRRLGPDRVAWAYPFASMLDAGVRVRGGSDAPIETADPLVGMRDAMAERPESLGRDAAVDLYAVGNLDAGDEATFVLVRGEPGSEEATVAEVWLQGEKTV